MKGCLIFLIGITILGIVVELFHAMFYLLVGGGYILGAMLIWLGAKKLYEKIAS